MNQPRLGGIRELEEGPDTRKFSPGSGDECVSLFKAPGKSPSLYPNVILTFDRDTESEAPMCRDIAKAASRRPETIQMGAADWDGASIPQANIYFGILKKA